MEADQRVVAGGVGATARVGRALGLALVLALVLFPVVMASLAWACTGADYGLPSPAVSIDDVRVSEGNSGEVDATFTVSLSAPSTQAVAVDYATGDDSATQPDDDYAQASGTLSIPAGQRTTTVTVKVKGDTTPEPDERFFVNLSGPQSATIADGQGEGTILNDDDAPAPPPRDDSPPSGGAGSAPPGGSPPSGSAGSAPPGGSPPSGATGSAPPSGSPPSGATGSAPPSGSPPSGGAGSAPPTARKPSAFQQCTTKYRGGKNAKRRAACLRRAAVRQCTTSYKGRQKAKQRAACIRKAKRRYR